MNQEQLDVLNIVQEALRMVVLSLGAMNPQAMPKVGYALRAGASEGTVSPMARAMLNDLASGIDLLSAGQKPN